jgi:hypothetical protein
VVCLHRGPAASTCTASTPYCSGTSRGILPAPASHWTTSPCGRRPAGQRRRHTRCVAFGTVIFIGAGRVFCLLSMTMTGCAAFDRKSPAPPRPGPSINTLGRSVTRATPLQGSGKAAPSYWSDGRSMRVHVETHGLRPRLTRTPVCLARTTTPLPPPKSVCQHAGHAAQAMPPTRLHPAGVGGHEGPAVNGLIAGLSGHAYYDGAVDICV